MRKKLRKFWVKTFWKSPQRLQALKVCFSICLGLIPLLYAGQNYLGATFSLGVVATALSETQVHPRLRLKTSVLKLVCFWVTATVVQWAWGYPIFFGFLLIFSTFFLLILGGINGHYQKVTFGILLLTVYTLLGMNPHYSWWYQPTFYVIGGGVYSLVSGVMLYLKPWRGLKELLSAGFEKIALYTVTKSELFPSDAKKQRTVRNKLAQINIDISAQIDLLFFELNHYYKASSDKGKALLSAYYKQWELLQELHIRLASSHEKYDLLSQNPQSPEIMEGFGQLMKELGKAIGAYAQNLLADEPYSHPISLQWTTIALKEILEKRKSDKNYVALCLLFKNLSEIEKLLRQFANTSEQAQALNWAAPPKKTSLGEILKISHPRFRFSVRLTLCYLVAYVLIKEFNITKGAWILMTCLIIAQQTYSATTQRLAHRIMGTLAGVILGFILNALLPTKEGQLLLMLGSEFLFFYWIQSNYTLSVVFITTFVLAIFNLQMLSGAEVMVPRIIDTVLAGALVYVATRFIWPDWQYKKLPALLAYSVKENLEYFRSVSYLPTDENTRIALKNNAHLADNKLTMAWKGMLSEPKGKRSLIKNAYNISYLNHSLLSYIAALHSQKIFTHLSADEKQICQEIDQMLCDTLHLENQYFSIEDMSQRIAHYQGWEQKLFEQKKISQSPSVILLHNIANVSLSLLSESYSLELRKIKKSEKLR